MAHLQEPKPYFVCVMLTVCLVVIMCNDMVHFDTT